MNNKWWLNCVKVKMNETINKHKIPELSFPFSGLPLEYIVANLPSNIKRNHPFDPFDSSRADESDQTYKQSRPRQILHSCQ